MNRSTQICQVGGLLLALACIAGLPAPAQEPENSPVLFPIAAEPDSPNEIVEFELLEPPTADEAPAESQPAVRRPQSSACPVCGLAPARGANDRAVGQLRRSYAEAPNANVDTRGRLFSGPIVAPDQGDHDASPYEIDQPTAAGRAEVPFLSLPYLERFIASAREGRSASRRRPTSPLKPGEAAQIILELRERLGDSALDGTDFSELEDPSTDEPGASHDDLVNLIRALDEDYERHQREQASRDTELPHSERAYYPMTRGGADTPAGALRASARSLDEAAETLEQQNLFEPADHLRGLADQLRHQARATTQAHASIAEPRYAAPSADCCSVHDNLTAELEEQVRQIREDLRTLREALTARSGTPVEQEASRPVPAKRVQAIRPSR